MSRQSSGELGILGGVAMLSTSLLGTGIFVVPVLGVMEIGALSLWSWIFLLAMMLPIAVVFGLLGNAHPHAGGVSHWVAKSFGQHAEWVVAMLFVLVIPAGIPAAMGMALVFAKAIFPLNDLGAMAVQITLLLIIYGINRANIRASSVIQSIIALVILLFIASLWWRSSGVQWQPPKIEPDALPSVFASLSLLIWCFLGIEIIAHLAEEFRHPKRALPWVTFLGLAIAGGVYYLCAALVAAYAADHGAETGVMIDMVRQGYGEIATVLFAVIGLLACLASVNTYTAGFTRLIWSLADEQKLPNSLGVLRGKVPVAALNLVTGTALASMLIFALFDQDLEQLIRLSNGNFILVYLAAMAAGVSLLRGIGRIAALLGWLLCALAFAALGFAAMYAIVWVLLLSFASRWVFRAQAAKKPLK
ncbi:MAG: L-methionine/branched-chain amino acid transporter [Gammaproteobacteria bacterium]|nr:L-methionine/branched-chain amino acid transporter [Gammaproteobacteria bacterium]